MPAEAVSQEPTETIVQGKMDTSGGGTVGKDDVNNNKVIHSAVVQSQNQRPSPLTVPNPVPDAGPHAPPKGDGGSAVSATLEKKIDELTQEVRYQMAGQVAHLGQELQDATCEIVFWRSECFQERREKERYRQRWDKCVSRGEDHLTGDDAITIPYDDSASKLSLELSEARQLIKKYEDSASKMSREVSEARRLVKTQQDSIATWKEAAAKWEEKAVKEAKKNFDLDESMEEKQKQWMSLEAVLRERILAVRGEGKEQQEQHEAASSHQPSIVQDEGLVQRVYEAPSHILDKPSPRVLDEHRSVKGQGEGTDMGQGEAPGRRKSTHVDRKCDQGHGGGSERHNPKLTDGGGDGVRHGPGVPTQQPKKGQAPGKGTKVQLPSEASRPQGAAVKKRCSSAAAAGSEAQLTQGLDQSSYSGSVTHQVRSSGSVTASCGGPGSKSISSRSQEAAAQRGRDYSRSASSGPTSRGRDEDRASQSRDTDSRTRSGSSRPSRGLTSRGHDEDRASQSRDADSRERSASSRPSRGPTSRGRDE